MNRRAAILEAEITFCIRGLLSALKIRANVVPNPFYNPETGEDMIWKLVELTADFMEMLLEMDEDELISFHSRKRLN